MLSKHICRAFRRAEEKKRGLSSFVAHRTTLVYLRWTTMPPWESKRARDGHGVGHRSAGRRPSGNKRLVGWKRGERNDTAVLLAWEAIWPAHVVLLRCVQAGGRTKGNNSAIRRWFGDPAFHRHFATNRQRHEIDGRYSRPYAIIEVCC